MKKWNLVLKRQKTMGQALAILVTAGLALTGCGSSKSYSYEATNTAAEAPAAADRAMTAAVIWETGVTWTKRLP